MTLAFFSIPLFIRVVILINMVNYINLSLFNLNVFQTQLELVELQSNWKWLLNAYHSQPTNFPNSLEDFGKFVGYTPGGGYHLLYAKTFSDHFVYPVYHVSNMDLLNSFRFDLIGFSPNNWDHPNLWKHQDAIMILFQKVNLTALLNGIKGIQLLNNISELININNSIVNLESVLSVYGFNISEWLHLEYYLHDIRVFNDLLELNDYKSIYQLLDNYRYNSGSLFSRDEVHNLFGITCGLGDNQLLDWANYYGVELERW